MSRQILSKEEKLEVKRERIPVHEARDRLTKYKGLDFDNFVYRMVNVSKGPYHVDRFLNAGYTFVAKDSEGLARNHVDSFEGVSSIITEGGGKGVTLALMCIPKEFYEQDQAAKQLAIQEQEDEMRRDLMEKSDRSQGNYGKVEHFGSMFGRAPGPIPK